jgi:hypothetical protein
MKAIIAQMFFEEIGLEFEDFLATEQVGLSQFNGLQDQVVSMGPTVCPIIGGTIADIETHDLDRLVWIRCLEISERMIQQVKEDQHKQLGCHECFAGTDFHGFGLLIESMIRF